MSKQKVAAPQAESAARPAENSGVALYGRWVPLKVEGLAGVKHTLNLDTEEGKAALVAAGSPADIDMPDGGRARLEVRNFAAFWDQEEDEETGDVKEFIRSVFYDKDGRTFRTTAPHAPHFFARCVDVYGWERIRDDGLPITIARKRGKRGYDYHDFRVELPSKPADGRDGSGGQEEPF